MPTGVYSRSEKQKKQICKNLTHNYWLGKHRSEDTKKKAVETRIRNASYKVSDSTKEKISKSLKGIKRKSQTTEHKQNMVNTRRLNGSYNRERHWNWQNGKSYEPYSVDWTKTLKRAIKERDRYTCQICNSEGKVVHHIDYDKKNCNSNNLITLCLSCHIKTNYNRENWIKYFKNKVR